jgi:RNA polymerase sigma-70 factor, ECF subfamily
MSVSFSERLLAELTSLLRVARRLTRSEADAEDLVQATIVRAIERRFDLRDGERMRGWLLQVQRTVHLNRARGLARRLEVLKGGLSESEQPSRDLEAELTESGFADEVDDALGRLAPELRDALLLREVEGLGYEEIAEVQQCPVGSLAEGKNDAALAIPLGRPHLVEFVSDHCTVCARMAPVVENLEGACTQGDGSVVRVNVESSGGRALAQRFNVHAVPTFLQLDAEGEEVVRVIGEQTHEQLALALQSVRGTACKSL